MIFIGRSEENKDSPIEKLRRKLDALFGRFVYNKRIAMVERAAHRQRFALAS
jgi:hypothetical protein